MTDGSGRLVAWSAFILAFAALNFGSRFASGKPPKDFLYTWSASIGGLVQYAVILGVVLAISAGVRDKRSLLGLRRPHSWAAAAGIAGLVLVGVFVLGLALDPFLHAGREQGLTPSRWEPNRAAAYAASVVVLAGVGPAVEELTFRGLGYSLLERLGRTAAILLVGLTFALAHGLIDGLPIFVAFGSGLAYLRSRTGSIYPGIIVHAAFNGIALIAAVA